MQAHQNPYESPTEPSEPEGSLATPLGYACLAGLGIAVLSFGIAFVLTLFKHKIGSLDWARPWLDPALAIGFFSGLVIFAVCGFLWTIAR